MLIEHLPPTAAVWAALVGADAGWTVTDHLLAAGVDALRIANWQRSGGSRSNPAPKPIPRPGDEHRRRVDADRWAQRLIAQRDRKGS